MPGRIDLNFSLGQPGDGHDGLLRRSDAMRILVLGDFSGRRSRSNENAADLASRPIIPLDPDNFASALRQVSPSLDLGGVARELSGVSIRFDTLEDFHPDHLYMTLDPFRALRESRARLLDGASFEQEAARLMQSAQVSPVAEHAGAAPRAVAAEKEVDLLQRLIGAPREPTSASAPSIVDSLIRRVVGPQATAGSARSREPFIAALDASATDLMRALLHAPDFQALEAIWRGVGGLVASLELGDRLELCLLDVSREELLADLASCGGDVQLSATYRRIARTSGGADANCWSLLLGHYSFGARADDLALLEFLAVIAARIGAPLLAAAEPSLAGCPGLSDDAQPRSWAFSDVDLERRWSTLRRSKVAPWLGLAMPRILSRLPYGAQTDPVDAFAFEEMTGSTGHDAYLWGNPALPCARVIAQSFLDDRPGLSDVSPLEIDDLPAHVRERDGERRLQPCAEFLLPVRAGDELLQRGMIPLLSYGNRNAVRIMAVQSIAEPRSALAGLA